MQLSLRVKLIAAFVLNVVLMVVLGAFAIYQMESMNARAEFLGDRTIPSILTAANMRGSIHRYRGLQTAHVANRDISEIDQVEREQKV